MFKIIQRDNQYPIQLSHNSKSKDDESSNYREDVDSELQVKYEDDDDLSEESRCTMFNRGCLNGVNTQLSGKYRTSRQLSSSRIMEQMLIQKSNERLNSVRSSERS